MTRSVLDRDAIVYLATSEHHEPSDRSGFVPDGHYTAEVNRVFAEIFLHLALGEDGLSE
jgi:hypothetical protein